MALRQLRWTSLRGSFLASDKIVRRICRYPSVRQAGPVSRYRHLPHRQWTDGRRVVDVRSTKVVTTDRRDSYAGIVEPLFLSFVSYILSVRVYFWAFARSSQIFSHWRVQNQFKNVPSAPLVLKLFDSEFCGGMVSLKYLVFATEVGQTFQKSRKNLHEP